MQRESGIPAAAGDVSSRLRPKVRESAKEAIYRSLKAAILSNDLRSGSPLSEEDVAQAFGVSRTPVREALARLVDEGLIEVFARRGYFVAGITVQDVLDAYQLRIILEPEAAALAAGFATDAVIAALESQMREHRRHATAESNRLFHLLIAETSRNTRLARFIERLIDEVERVTRLDPYSEQPSDWGLNEHDAIINGLAARDGEAARQSMRRHLEASRERVLDQIRQGGCEASQRLSPTRSEPRGR